MCCFSKKNPKIIKKRDWMSQSRSKKIASMWGNAMNKLGSMVSGDSDSREEEENRLPELDENLAIALRLVCERIRTHHGRYDPSL